MCTTYKFHIHHNIRPKENTPVDMEGWQVFAAVESECTLTHTWKQKIKVSLTNERKRGKKEIA